MKVALISCGRSDFSIYLPLLKYLKEDSFFKLDIIAFGTHVSAFYDKTVEMFYNEGFEVEYELESLVLGDSPEAISSAIGLTAIKFSSIWAKENYDLIFVLGDRYEMFAAVAASVPFNIPVAHIHGGETTLGAIDNKFRHCITSMSSLHFASSENHSNRVKEILGQDKNVYNVGALALDNLKEIKLFTKKEFKEKWGIDLELPSILVTFHPETVSPEKNIKNIKELCAAMEDTDKQFVITMPNNDTFGTVIRDELLKLSKRNKEKYKTVEVLGVLGYYSCLQHCELLLGNSSSGIIEAASFNKYVINISDRQKGRECGDNVFHIPASKNAILEAIQNISKLPLYKKDNIYGNGNTVSKIIPVVKEFYLNK